MSTEAPTDERASILLVDDMEENLVALEAVLGSLDEQLVRARSGEEALKALLRAGVRRRPARRADAGHGRLRDRRQHQAPRPDQGRADHLPDRRGRRLRATPSAATPRAPPTSSPSRSTPGCCAPRSPSSSTCTARTGSWSGCWRRSRPQYDEVSSTTGGAGSRRTWRPDDLPEGVAPTLRSTPPHMCQEPRAATSGARGAARQATTNPSAANVPRQQPTPRATPRTSRRSGACTPAPRPAASASGSA